MQDHKTLGRREFTVASAMAVLSGVAITVTGCGGGSSSGESPTAPSTPATPATPGTGAPSGGAVGTVGTNHGHAATISAAQLTAGNALELDITGESTHPHTVTLTADEVQGIGAGTRVTKMSSVNDAHSHTVTFN